MKEMRKDREECCLKVKIEVDDSELNKAIEKAKELQRILSQCNVTPKQSNFD